ncbi:ERF family protein [Clostridium sp. AM58-1XD]|uniref:ERF family protein n=1 Tax=Clostridium sp. AM58-1XD TaxID=2292307 RepID=UPI000E549B51|nr:ERF family protein [Clostridium sp. AM58-1XD]RGZ00189.1 hypothetical protein DXA13_06195 [Clostridium sp. AM58-1XD]
MNQALEKLMKIQKRIKAPKDLTNTFGGYTYRSMEGIIKAFKPFEEEYHVLLKLDDDMVQIGDRHYIKATATIYDVETGDEISANAFARESLSRKGMDDSQITGTASTYARKYALNGLLLLDDTKDADTEEYLQEQDDNPADPARKKIIEAICAKHKIKVDQLCKVNAISWDTLTDVQSGKLLNSLKAKFGDD